MLYILQRKNLNLTFVGKFNIIFHIRSGIFSMFSPCCLYEPAFKQTKAAFPSGSDHLVNTQPLICDILCHMDFDVLSYYTSLNFLIINYCRRKNTYRSISYLMMQKLKVEVFTSK